MCSSDLDATIGGGGGPTDRNDFVFEAGIPFTLLFGDLVRFTAHPYLQVYTDKNCPTQDDLTQDPSLAKPGQGEQRACGNSTSHATGKWIFTDTDGTMYNVGQDPRTRFAGARFMLQAVLEIAVATNANIFFLFEGDPVGQRQSLTGKFSSALPNTDPQIYGRLGVTFKF